MTSQEIRFQVALSCIQGVLEAKHGIFGEIVPSIAVKESLRIADEFVKQWFGDTVVDKVEEDVKEWSEEDKLKLDNLIGLVEEIKRQPLKRLEDWDGYINWLKSLRPPLKDREMKLKILKYLSTRCSSLEFEEVEDYLNGLRPSWKPSEEQMPAEWKPLPESMEALLLAIEGKWDAIKPTGYMSRRLEDLYDGLVNTFDVDEKYLGNLPKTEYTEKDIEEIKALKEKIDSSMETKPAEWSEVDILTLDSIISIVEDWESEQSEEEKEYYGATQKSDFLKSLPERFNLQPKQEWSEEDEAFLKIAIAICNRYSHKDIADWLKSLRPSWKPSEEQMNSLQEVIVLLVNLRRNVGDRKSLESLYNDLKNL